MSDNPQHIIQKQVFDIRHGSYVNAHARQTEISTRYENEVIPLLEKICDELCPGDRIIKIDTLVIALPVMTESDYKAKWATEVEKAFREQLSKVITQAGQSPQNNANTTILSRADADLQLLTAFLYTGIMPWSYSENKPGSPEMIFRALIATKKPAVRQLVTEGIKQRSFAERLCYQFSDSLLTELFSLLQPSRATAVRNCYQWLQDSLKKVKDPGDQSDIGFLLRYHSLQLLTKQSYQNEEQCIRQLLEPVSHQWKIPFPELLDKLIWAVKSTSANVKMTPFLHILEVLHKAPEAIATPEKTLRKTPLPQKEKRKTEDHSLQKQLQQLFRGAEKIAVMPGQESEALISTLKKQLEQSIALIESRKDRKDDRYEKLSGILKQWLRVLEQGEDTLANISDRFKDVLKVWWNDHKAEGVRLKVEDPAESGDTAAQKSDALSPEAAIANRVHRESQPLLREAAHTGHTDVQERNVFYTSLKAGLQQYIEQLQSLPLKAVTSYEVLLSNLEQLLKEAETADENAVKQYENLKLALAALLKRLPGFMENSADTAAQSPDEAIPGIPAPGASILQNELQQLSREATDIENIAGAAPDAETSGAAFERLKTFIKTIIEDAAPGEENTRERPQQSRKVLETEEMYLQNAGLVIVWPFFKQLFEALGLTEEHQFVNEAKQYRAIHLLQYLVSGEAHCEEYRLGLNKFLCGLELNEPIPRQITLSENEKESAEDLIKAATGHWPVMKNTSLEGFRQAFLLRDGKLSRNSDGWLLQVEQKSYDMIMNKLPWSIGLVKLPWMPDALFVEW